MHGRVVLVVVLSILFASALAVQVGDVAFSYSFRTSGSLSGWTPSAAGKCTLVTPGYVSGAYALQIATTSGDIFFERAIDLSAYAGCTLQLSAITKASGVTQPSASYLGMKTMVSVKGASEATENINKANVYGTFGWSTNMADATIPVYSDITGATITLGLQSSTGTAWWDSIQLVVTAVPQPATPAPTVKPTLAPTKAPTLAPTKAPTAKPTTAPTSKPATPSPSPTTPGAPFNGHPGIARLRGLMSPGQFAQADFDNLVAWKPNVMRWQMDHNAPGWGTDLSLYDTWISSQLTILDQALVAARNVPMLLIVDLHALPGGDNGSTYAYFLNVTYQDKLVSVWQTIATKYKGNTAIWAYDICNEPHGTPAAGIPSWNSLGQRVINAIRAIDPVMPIMVESTQWDSPSTYPSLAVFTGGNIIYSVHMYTPQDFTSQGTGSHPYPAAGTYPGVVDGTYYNITTLRNFLQPARTFQLAHNIAIHVGEFSAVRWAPNAIGYLQDCITIFEEWGWDWTYHAYRECDCWSVEYGSDKNNLTHPIVTDRQMLLRSYFAQNQNPYSGTGR